MVTARPCGSVHMHVDVVGGSEAETLSHSHRQSFMRGRECMAVVSVGEKAHSHKTRWVLTLIVVICC